MKVEDLLKQSAIDNSTSSAVSAAKTAGTIASATSSLQRLVEEQRGLIGAFNENSMQQLARQIRETIIGSRGFADSLTESFAPNACAHLAETLKSINKDLLGGFRQPNISAMIADIVGQTSAFNGMENIFTEHRKRIEEIAENFRVSFKPPSEEIGFLRRPDFESVSASHLHYSALPKPVEGGAPDFMQRLNEHIEEAKAEAEETGSRLIVKCKMPNGDDIWVSQLSMEDSYFITVTGVDSYGQQRSFKGHFNAIGISIEVVASDDEENEEENEMPIN